VDHARVLDLAALTVMLPCGCDTQHDHDLSLLPHKYLIHRIPLILLHAILAHHSVGSLRSAPKNKSRVQKFVHRLCAVIFAGKEHVLHALYGPISQHPRSKYFSCVSVVESCASAVLASSDIRAFRVDVSCFSTLLRKTINQHNRQQSQFECSTFLGNKQLK
jgi:hypothetical protein